MNNIILSVIFAGFLCTAASGDGTDVPAFFTDPLSCSLPIEKYQELQLLPKDLSPKEYITRDTPGWSRKEFSREFENSTTFSVEMTSASRVSNYAIILENTGTAPLANPWVVINGRGSWFDVDSMVAEICGPETDPGKKAFLIWLFLKQNRYHWYPAEAGSEIHSPVKFINIYGCGFCDDSATNAELLFKRAGFSQARVWGLYGHVVPEVFYNGAWHLLDPDLEIFYPEWDNLTVAGVETLAADGALIRRISDSSIESLYTTTLNNFTYQNHWDAAFTMAMNLRPRERLERYWTNWGKFHDNNEKQKPWRLGNGRLIYSPDILSSQFIDGLDEFVNLRVIPEDDETTGTLVQDNPAQLGRLACKMKSAYVFVGGVAEMDIALKGTTDAILLEYATTPTNWQTIMEWAGPFSGTISAPLDDLIKPLVNPACYEFRVRITLKGNGGASLQRLEINGEIQCAPTALPALIAARDNAVDLRFTPEPGARLRITQIADIYDETLFLPVIESPILPPDEGMLPLESPRLEWDCSSTSNSVLQQEILISHDAEGILPVTPPYWRQLGPGCAWNLPGQWLVPNREYFWRLRTKNSSNLWGPWSDTWRFTVEDNASVHAWILYGF